MPDNLTPADRKRTMQSVKSKRTSLERRLHAMLAGSHRLSGWRLNYEDAPGKPDFAFPDYKVAIFVDGCFWHGCPHCKRPLPETNHEYWERKIQRNIKRDQLHDMQLRDAGWRVFRIWEHQLKDKNECQMLLDQIHAILGEQNG